MRVSTNNIFTVLSEEVGKNIGKNISWSDMMQAIQKSGMKIKNWMTVRNVLQYMINEGMVTRTNNIHAEDYICVKGQ